MFFAITSHSVPFIQYAPLQIFFCTEHQFLLNQIDSLVSLIGSTLLLMHLCVSMCDIFWYPPPVSSHFLPVTVPYILFSLVIWLYLLSHVSPLFYFLNLFYVNVASFSSSPRSTVLVFPALWDHVWLTFFRSQDTTRVQIVLFFSCDRFDSCSQHHLLQFCLFVVHQENCLTFCTLYF